MDTSGARRERAELDALQLRGERAFAARRAQKRPGLRERGQRLHHLERRAAVDEAAVGEGERGVGGGLECGLLRKAER